MSVSELFVLIIFCFTLWYVARRMNKSIQAGKKGRGCGECPGCSCPGKASGCEGDFLDKNDVPGSSGSRE